MELISLVGIAGIIVSIYAIYVEKMAKSSGAKKYIAICDVNDSASCSLVLMSQYSRLGEVYLGLKKDSWFNHPNTYYGLLFYIAVTIYPMYPFTLIPYRELMLFGASIFSILICCLLAWILYFKLNNFCAVCVASYIVNIVILMLSYRELIDKISGICLFSE